MNASEYLDAAKERLCLSSDYGLAKKLELRPEHMGAFRSGKRAIPTHLAFRLAITLELDPSEVIADLESQREKNPQRAELYRSFLSRVRKVGGILACTLGLILSVGVGADRVAGGGSRREPYFA
jgi:hypothetical protein